MSDVFSREDLDALASRREQLTAALALAASHLQTAGTPPGEDLLDDLRDFQSRLQQACLHVEESVGCSLPRHRADGRLAIDDLERVVEIHQERGQLLQTLHGLLALRHTQIEVFEPLTRCQADARRLLEALLNERLVVPPAALSLILGEHPLASVAALAKGAEQLSDDEWSAHLDVVSRAFGRNLATAFVRGRIERPDAPLPADAPVVGRHVPSAVVSQAGAHSKPECDGANGLAASAAPPDDCRQHYADCGENATAETDLVRSECSLATRAQLLLSATDANRPQRRRELLLELLRERKFAVAAHLTTVWTAGDDDWLPGSLLRCLALVQHLGYSRGKLARRIEIELQQVQRKVRGCSESALPWFVRSATLVPALLGASTTAALLQRAFGIEPGLGQLFNFSARVATFGERLAGKASELFRSLPTEEQQLQERDRLQRDIERWQAESVRRSARYGRSSQLFLHAHWTLLASPARRHSQAVHEWAKWQEVLTLSHRLVRPAREGAFDERMWVRREVRRLESLVKSAEPTVPHADSSAPSRWNADMRATALEAVDLANRWLRLQALEPKAKWYTPQVDELRCELLERTPAVLAELKHREGAARSPWERCGIDCCRSAVVRIRDLCAGQTMLPLHEPDVTQIFTGELCVWPDISFNARGEPSGDLRQWERRVLQRLSGDSVGMQTVAEKSCAVAANDIDLMEAGSVAVGATSPAMTSWVF